MAAHHPQPLVSVLVLEVLPGPARAGEHSLSIATGHRGGTCHPLPVAQGRQDKMPLLFGAGVASLAGQSGQGVWVLFVHIQAEEPGSANAMLLMVLGGLQEPGQCH